MLNGKFKGREIGSGTDVWRFADDVATGCMSRTDFFEAESCMSRSAGHCMTMGTASTMACMVESLGLGLTGNAAIPAVDSRRYVLAHQAGKRAAEMVSEDLRISKILTREAMENAIRVNGAIGGSTNAVVHLLDFAGRVGGSLSLDDWERFGQDIPCLLNLMPSGKYLMEDFYYAGGLPALLKELEPWLNLEVLTVNGKTLGENIAGATCFNREVIRPRSQPFKPQGGVAVLKGNLAPNGAVLKPSAATPELMQHTGKAVVFEDIEDYKARINDPDLEVEPADILVLKNCGPRGYPGFPEVGNLTLPSRILSQGISDMVRISDARMSGTAYGTVVLHTAPEAAVGGPLALVENGDLIELDVAGRRLELKVAPQELERRRAGWRAPPTAERGWYRLYQEHVLQADRGVDLDFLVGKSGTPRLRESH